MSNWTMDPDGSISVRPLIGWEMAPAMAMAVAARLELLNPEGSAEPRSFVQIVVAPAMAFELAQALTQLATGIVLAAKPDEQPS